MPNKPPAELIRFLKPYERAIQKLALDLRLIVIDELGPCHENIYDAYSAVAIGYGSSEHLCDGVCHMAVYARGVNLGFNQGALLEDPDDEGNGQKDSPSLAEEPSRPDTAADSIISEARSRTRARRCSQAWRDHF